MRTLHCDYFTPKSLMTPDGQYWGVVGITNHSAEKQVCALTVLDYDSGKEINRIGITLQPMQSMLLTNQHEPFLDMLGRTRLYLDCSPFVTATVGNTKGKTSALSWERMVELPFPKA